MESQCVVCDSTKDVFEYDLRGRLLVPACNTCFDTGRLKEWLAFEFEKTLAQNPCYQRNPDGTWEPKQEPVDA